MTDVQLAGTCPGIDFYRKLQLYQTKSRVYVVGFSKTTKKCTLLKISRQEGPFLDAIQDPVEYSVEECNALLKRIHEGNIQHGGLQLLCKAYGVLGCFRFTDTYYLLVITKREFVGRLCGQKVYRVAATQLLPISHTYRQDNPSSQSMAERRYRKILQGMDLTKGFFFSYTYRLGNTLQVNLTRTASGDDSGVFSSMFVWNAYLTQDLRNMVGNARWTVPIIHGFFDQRAASVFGRVVVVTLIARRSRYFAGTRFRKRGISEQGRVANEVETEQLVDAGIDSRTSQPLWSSVVQVRGSVPLYWSQQATPLSPKPDILLQYFDPLFQVTDAHFQDLRCRYGNPVVVLNLLKSKEHRPREMVLRKELATAINLLNHQMPPEQKLWYIPWDFQKYAKQSGSNILVEISTITKLVQDVTGIFVNPRPPPASRRTKPLPQDPDLSPPLGRFVQGRLQTGVLRTNCIDCLDRTNVAQFAYGVVAFGQQLYELGVADAPELDSECSITFMLMEMYESMGNSIALQYGGSEAHSVFFQRKKGEWEAATQSKDIYTSIKRFYSNTYTDAEKQDAINLFLGNFAPEPGKPDIWDLDSDQYLHSIKWAEIMEQTLAKRLPRAPRVWRPSFTQLPVLAAAMSSMPPGKLPSFDSFGTGQFAASTTPALLSAGSSNSTASTTPAGPSPRNPVTPSTAAAAAAAATAAAPVGAADLARVPTDASGQPAPPAASNQTSTPLKAPLPSGPVEAPPHTPLPPPTDPLQRPPTPSLPPSLVPGAALTPPPNSHNTRGAALDPMDIQSSDLGPWPLRAMISAMLGGEPLRLTAITPFGTKCLDSFDHMTAKLPRTFHVTLHNSGLRNSNIWSAVQHAFTFFVAANEPGLAGNGNTKLIPSDMGSPPFSPPFSPPMSPRATSPVRPSDSRVESTALDIPAAIATPATPPAPPAELPASPPGSFYSTVFMGGGSKRLQQSGPVLPVLNDIIEVRRDPKALQAWAAATPRPGTATPRPGTAGSTGPPPLPTLPSVATSGPSKTTSAAPPPPPQPAPPPTDPPATPATNPTTPTAFPPHPSDTVDRPRVRRSTSMSSESAGITISRRMTGALSGDVRYGGGGGGDTPGLGSLTLRLASDDAVAAWGVGLLPPTEADEQTEMEEAGPPPPDDFAHIRSPAIFRQGMAELHSGVTTANVSGVGLSPEAQLYWGGTRGPRREWFSTQQELREVYNRYFDDSWNLEQINQPLKQFEAGHDLLDSSYGRLRRIPHHQEYEWLRYMPVVLPLQLIA